MQRNFAQWRNLAITIAYPVLRSYPIAYTSPLADSRPTEGPLPPLSTSWLTPVCSRCIMHTPRPDKWRARRTVLTGLSCTSIIQVGVRDAPGAQEVSRLGAQVTRSNWRKLSSLKRAPITRGIAHVVKPRRRYRAAEASGKQLGMKRARRYR